jgi:1-acyl-sn-glycerol-3-phosphate acyltransferase
VLRSVFAAVATVVLTLVFGVPALFLSLVNPRGDWVLRFGRSWARGICAAAGVSVTALGVANIPADRPVILISNHQSHFDMLALLLTMPRPFRVVAKRHLFYIPVFGWCLYLAGMIPIDREKRSSAFQSLERAADRIRGGEPVLFFPEGTRSRDGQLLPFKKGAFVIALKAGAPIVPVSVAGSLAVLPKGSLRIRPGHITVRYGPEIAVASETLDTKERLIDRVREAVARGLAGPRPEAPHEASARS